jgi:hypothetical protein
MYAGQIFLDRGRADAPSPIVNVGWLQELQSRFKLVVMNQLDEVYKQLKSDLQGLQGLASTV